MFIFVTIMFILCYYYVYIMILLRYYYVTIMFILCCYYIVIILITFFRKKSNIKKLEIFHRSGWKFGMPCE